MADRRVTRLADLTWPEVVERFRSDPRLLLPVASCVQHGPHLPLGTDAIVTTAVAEGLGARHGVLVAPTVPFGVVSEVDAGYAGTAGIREKTLHRLLNEVVGAWEGHGVERLFLLTSHGFGRHYGALVSVLSERARIRAVDVNVVDLSPVLRVPHRPERAGEVETSLLLHLAPGLVRTGRIDDLVPAEKDRRARVDGSEPLPLPGTPGVVGRPSAATAEKGRRIYEYLVRYIGDRLFEEARIAADE